MISVMDFEWDDRYLVGHKDIDDTHEEFIVLLNAILRADDCAIPAIMGTLTSHVEKHFALEARLMEQYAYPARECHIEEHENVLASIGEVNALVAGGNTEIACDFAAALIEWFPGHSDYMDSALAAWISRARTGGAPVVLRRTKAQATNSASTNFISIPHLLG